MAFPIENRVKNFESVALKTNKYNSIKSIKEINDIVGIRIITVFENDIEKICNMVRDTFVILREEDTRKRLKESQFGYGSIHFEIELDKTWLSIPTFKGLGNLRIELQIRTASQHIWAVSSHILQYKKENDVPESIKRTIHRIAVLLELVDLEFKRVLEEQEKYNREIDILRMADLLLNTSILKFFLEKELPEKNNAYENENYSELLVDLSKNGIETAQELIKLIRKHYDSMIQYDRDMVRDIKNQYNELEYLNNKRLKNGVYFTFTGLVRKVLEFEFGEQNWTNFENDTEDDEIFSDDSNYFE